MLSGTRARWLAVVVTVLGLLPTLAAPVVSAQTDDPYVVYLPWVANGEMIGGQGPWHSVITVQNVSDDFCAAQVFVVYNGRWRPWTQLSLPEGHDSRSVPTSALQIPQPGSPVRLEAACPISATVKQYTPDASVPPWSDGSQIVTGYAGIGAADVAAARANGTSAWFLPIVQTNSGWNTFIQIANLSATTATTVTVEIYPSGNISGANGRLLTLIQPLDVTETWTIDTLAVLGTSGFVGMARVAADGEIGVIARRVKPSAMMALINVAVAADGSAGEGSYRTLAPLLFNAYNGWNTGINIANVSEQSAIVTVQYYAANDGLLRQESIFIAPRAMQYVYTPGNVAEEGFVGSAAILSNVPVVAAVDEVKYETVEALSYMASGAPQHSAAIPIVFREDPANGHHDNSGINIANLDPLNEQTLFLQIRSTMGEELLSLPLAVTLPPGGNSFVYVPFLEDIPPGTVASVTLESQDEAGFVAISNDINYGAGGDGSVVFSATGNGGVYFVPLPEP